ncbi:hypothetical protein PNK_p0020 (plasmid) [Candidatus Protochlamydia naegleriophila]|uniref:Uncharacterized protein n=1 Tax=Candidatus Protochlamydia naegleriophila TaxID=389348 RepID=A0A0U5JGR7_9BACT|nr:hypothetical protein [Candidatus Protochlamydia naegleriophila]CUI18074.1 hypothetical protein PNK_p0020 [Candidatus Protochlamydia naegleriophila]
MSDFNFKQLKLIIQKINDYRKGKIYLAWLISDIESLINILEDPNEDWKADLRTSWLDLEEVYAFALADEKEHLDQKDIRIIDEGLHKLETLIGDQLKTIKSPEDDC